jgi:hypothetical protein
MAMSQKPEAGSNFAGFDAQTSIERSLALALSPFRQGLRFYADFQRSALETFTRATGGTAVPVMASATRSPKPTAMPTVALKRGTTTKPAATKRPTAAKPATSKPATTKRPTTTKPATTKRPTAAKPATTKAARSAPGRAVSSSASKKPAAAKAAPKRVLKSTTGAKPAVAKVAKKVASSPTRPRATRAGASKKA